MVKFCNRVDADLNKLIHVTTLMDANVPCNPYFVAMLKLLSLTVSLGNYYSSPDYRNLSVALIY